LDGTTFEEAMREKLNLLTDFVKGLEYQVQFRDHRMLDAVEREGSGFLRLAKACLMKERRAHCTRGAAPATWEKGATGSMFYRTRPPTADANM
jgi:hypothetical protein